MRTNIIAPDCRVLSRVLIVPDCADHCTRRLHADCIIVQSANIIAPDCADRCTRLHGRWPGRRAAMRTAVTVLLQCHYSIITALLQYHHSTIIALLQYQADCADRCTTSHRIAHDVAQRVLLLGTN